MKHRVLVIHQRKIPARDWSKSRHATFTNTPLSSPQQQRSDRHSALHGGTIDNSALR